MNLFPLVGPEGPSPSGSRADSRVKRQCQCSQLRPSNWPGNHDLCDRPRDARNEAVSTHQPVRTRLLGNKTGLMTHGTKGRMRANNILRRASTTKPCPPD